MAPKEPNSRERGLGAAQLDEQSKGLGVVKEKNGDRRSVRRMPSGRRGWTLSAAAVGCAVLGVGGTVACAPQAETDAMASSSSAPPVGSRLLFVGDYETGDFGQWDICQTATINAPCTEFGRGDRTMRIVTDDVRQGHYAAEFEVRPGDVPAFGGTERAEVRSDAAGAVVSEGAERWYQWSMKFPAGFRNPTGEWFIVMQWHAGAGSPPLAINVSNKGTVDIGGDAVDADRVRTIGPVRRGEWVDYTVHVKFSRSADAGFVEAWENGKQTVDRTARATMSGASLELKQGIYRDTGAPTSLRIDGLRVTAP